MLVQTNERCAFNETLQDRKAVAPVVAFSVIESQLRVPRDGHLRTQANSAHSTMVDHRRHHVGRARVIHAAGGVAHGHRIHHAPSAQVEDVLALCSSGALLELLSKAVGAGEGVSVERACLPEPGGGGQSRERVCQSGGGGVSVERACLPERVCRLRGALILLTSSHKISPQYSPMNSSATRSREANAPFPLAVLVDAT